MPEALGIKAATYQSRALVKLENAMGVAVDIVAAVDAEACDHATGFRVEDHPRGIDRVAAHVEQRSAARRRLETHVPGIGGIDEIDRQMDARLLDFADHARGQQVLDAACLGMKAVHEAFHQFHAPALAFSRRGGGLGRRQGDRLLAQHMFS